jgi:hypothetical protein
MSPPPGNNGGAVSGEAPWLWAEEAQSNRMGASHTHAYSTLFVERTFPPEKGLLIWTHESGKPGIDWRSD